MQDRTRIGHANRHAFVLSILAIFLFISRPNIGHASTYDNLPVIKPIKSCADLTKADLSKVTYTAGTVKSAEMIETDKGPFCKVTTLFKPEIEVTTYMPAEHWTQRYFQGRGGDNPTSTNGFAMAGSCQPALNGEFVYGLSNVRFTMVVGERRGYQPDFVPDPQRIIDYSYRGNHVAALVSKALIKAYYGQGPRYSYFVGCSDGGRQGLMEAQRFPEDFDGIAAGSPGVISTAEESTFHLWKVQANQRADGTNILMPEKIKLLHDSVIAQCDTLSGVKDGILQDPNTCHFDPASMRCPSGAADTSNCFTAEEVTAIQNLYDGAHDDKGNYFEFGMPRGSEGIWNLPKTPTAEEPSASTHAIQLAFVMRPEPTPALSDYKKVTISKADFELASQRSSMFDSANTDLKPFAARDGKLILWHGLNDTLIPAKVTMAYYDSVEKFMGKDATEKFLRAFYPPGVGHCGGGHGYTEFDVLSPLMAWVETKQAPTEIVTGKTGAHRGPGAGGAQGANQSRASKPYATPMLALTATRPLYSYPYIARYTGKGDPNDASSYTRATSTAKPFPAFDYKALKLIGPDNQRDFEAKDGRLVEKDKH
jgi:feruloyl esterase